MSRTWLPRRLRTQLFLSYVVVVAAGAGAMLVVGAVVTRTVYERRIGGFGFGRGQGRDTDTTEAQLTSALDESLMPALLFGVGAALIAAAIVAMIVGTRLLRPIEQLRAATRRMAAGDFATPVPVPAEAELASLANDVNHLGEHLATIEQRRTQLLGEVTHEMRTPITVIRGQAEALLDGVVTPSPEAFAVIADEASRLQRIVDDLTLLSRADEGTLDIHLTALDLGAVSAAAAERLRPQFEYADVTLVVDVGGSPEPIPIRGDVDRLTQVLSNLLGNALGHTPAGGTVTLRPGRGTSLAFVDVIDTGPGVPVEEVERIFERFYRGPRSGMRQAGRGIGLTIARSLARAHGGDVVVQATSPGATFRLSIPISDVSRTP
ncbi:MAG TPA: HAMP domain-containing sensor histidine kinase [Ilumatobacteraceae bacterium]|nr:HAMP domain-containing sensor histidine kinase [Ilumatobacteraceae bacterium]